MLIALQTIVCQVIAACRSAGVRKCMARTIVMLHRLVAITTCTATIRADLATIDSIGIAVLHRTAWTLAIIMPDRECIDLIRIGQKLARLPVPISVAPILAVQNHAVMTVVRKLAAMEIAAPKAILLLGQKCAGPREIVVRNHGTATVAPKLVAKLIVLLRGRNFAGPRVIVALKGIALARGQKLYAMAIAVLNRPALAMANGADRRNAAKAIAVVPNAAIRLKLLLAM